jgi:hypothetical protein
MEAKSNSPLETHSCLTKLQLPGYIENHQFDAEECMTHIVDLFNPRVNDINDPRNNQVPDDCLFVRGIRICILPKLLQRLKEKFYTNLESYRIF